MRIRQYEPRDFDDLYDICLRTGAAGQDASEVFEDPGLLGHLYAGAYATLEPDLAWVVDDGTRAVGYVLGALDTVAFDARREAEWWPALRCEFPKDLPGRSEADELLVHLLHSPSHHDPGIVATYPSHLHIDLLPEAQGAGLGRRLMATECEALARAGSPGVHFGVAAANVAAQGFYDHLGFTRVADDGMIITYARDLPWLDH